MRLEELQEDILELFANIENDLLINIAKRIDINEEITPDNVADWQIDKLQQLRAFNEENQRLIAKHQTNLEKEIEKTYTSIGYESIADDERRVYERAIKRGILEPLTVTAERSESIRRVLEASIAQAIDKANLTNTTALQSANAKFTSIINQTFLEVSGGIKDYQSAVRGAVKKLADEGITGQTYQTSRGIMNYSIDAAVRREIVTSTVQTAGKMQIERANEYDINLVEVTSHLGARPDHARWQGKIYAINGTQQNYRNLSEATGYGTVTGLQGANCRHQFYPYVPGMSRKRNQPFNYKENDRVYDLNQKQRYLEREVRREKRRLIMLNQVKDQDGFKQASIKLKQKEANLREFKKATGRTQTSRVAEVGFNKSIARRATLNAKVE